MQVIGDHLTECCGQPYKGLVSHSVCLREGEGGGITKVLAWKALLVYVFAIICHISLACVFEPTEELLKEISPAMCSLAKRVFFFSLERPHIYFLSCTNTSYKNVWSSLAGPCESNTCGNATAPSPVFACFSARERQRHVTRRKEESILRN